MTPTKVRANELSFEIFESFEILDVFFIACGGKEMEKPVQFQRFLLAKTDIQHGLLGSPPETKYWHWHFKVTTCLNASIWEKRDGVQMSSIAFFVQKIFEKKTLNHKHLLLLSSTPQPHWRWLKKKLKTPTIFKICWRPTHSFFFLPPIAVMAPKFNCNSRSP